MRKHKSPFPFHRRSETLQHGPDVTSRWQVIRKEINIVKGQRHRRVKSLSLSASCWKDHLVQERVLQTTFVCVCVSFLVSLQNATHSLFHRECHVRLVLFLGDEEMYLMRHYSGGWQESYYGLRMPLTLSNKEEKVQKTKSKVSISPHVMFLYSNSDWRLLWLFHSIFVQSTVPFWPEKGFFKN